MTNKEAIEFLKNMIDTQSVGAVLPNGEKALWQYHIEALNMAISALQQHWIPVTERLPEENIWTICQNNAGAMMIGKYDIEFGWMFPAYFDGIIAWMHLPEPYKTKEKNNAGT